MSETVVVAVETAQRVTPSGRASASSRARTFLSIRNIGALYLFVILFIVYAIVDRNTFLTLAVWRALVDSGALTALTALALVLPLAAGAFDLAVGTEVGAGAITVAWLIGKDHTPLVPAILLTVAVGFLIGAVSGLLITRGRIDSAIATLGISSVLLAFISAVSGDQQILNLGPHLGKLGSGSILGLQWPVWIMLVVAGVMWYVLDRTAIGRRVYATGGNLDAARLAGVRTSRVILLCFATCGALATLAGLLTTASVGVGDPTVGPGFLLPSFAAAFLGSTQFRGGRYNVLGTVVAVYVLAVGVKGLQLAGAPTWIPDLFNGLALIVAVGAAKRQRIARRVRRFRRRPQPVSDTRSVGTPVR